MSDHNNNNNNNNNNYNNDNNNKRFNKMAVITSTIGMGKKTKASYIKKQ